jgi:hypothetical protein
VIEVAACVYAVSGIVFDDCLWNIPAALSYQMQLIFYQRQGNIFKLDNRADILAQL